MAILAGLLQKFLISLLVAIAGFFGLGVVTAQDSKPKTADEKRNHEINEVSLGTLANLIMVELVGTVASATFVLSSATYLHIGELTIMFLLALSSVIFALGVKLVQRKHPSTGQAKRKKKTIQSVLTTLRTFEITFFTLLIVVAVTIVWAA